MSTVAIKINLVDLNITKTLQYFSDKSVYEVIKDVQERVGSQAGGSDHGLYFPAQAKWLTNTKTLEFYDLKTGDLLEFKKKHRPLKVRMMDNSLKTVLIDESLSITQLVDAVCRKIGISNPEEYSFCREKNGLDGSDSNIAGTVKGKSGLSDSAKGTVKGKSGLSDPTKGTVKGKIEKDSKVTDQVDESNWLNPEKCLSEQGVTDTEIIILKKKFFFSDQNIDRNDPIQLNLVYVQSREAIITGKYPCTEEEASQFGSMQCQAQYGNYDAEKHKPGFLPLKDFLPVEYRKKKDIEKKIFNEHRKLQGMTELNAKYRYVQLCRSLKTYGVTFFQVREKIAKKNKYQPILLGVTRESVIRVDPDSKEVLRTWPLTTLRRWAATPSNFTLDFGDYSDAYYTVETVEGEKITQLIAGYIDIILKKKQGGDKFHTDEAEELAITEDNIEHAQASDISFVQGKMGRAMELNMAQTALLSDGSHISSFSTSNPRHQLKYMTIKKGGIGSRANQLAMMNAAVQSPHEAQTALIHTIQNGIANLSNVAASFSEGFVRQEIDESESSQMWKHQTLSVTQANVFGQLVSHVAAACAIINQTSVDPSRMNYSGFAASLSTLTSNLTHIVPNIKTIASLQSDPIKGDELLNLARNLAACTAKLLAVAQPCISGVGSRQELLGAGNQIGENASKIVNLLNQNEIPIGQQKELGEISRGVALNISNLAGVIKRIAQKAPDAKSNQELQAYAKLLSQTAAQLSTTVAMIAPFSSNALCQDQIDEAAVLMKDALMAVTAKSSFCDDSILMEEFKKTSGACQEALAKTLIFMRNGGKDSSATESSSEFDAPYEKLVKECQNLKTAGVYDPARIIQSVKEIATVTTEIINSMKAQAVGLEDGDEKSRLNVAVRKLNESIMAFVESSKDFAKNPNDPERRENFKAIIETFQQDVGAALGFTMRTKIFRDLLQAAKAAQVSSVQLITAGKAASLSNQNQASQLQLNMMAKKVSDISGNLSSAIQVFSSDVENPASQVKLLTTAMALITQSQAYVNACRSSTPFISDFAAQAQLSQFVSQYSDDLMVMQEASKKAEHISGDLELESAIENIKSIRVMLQDMREKGRIEKLPTMNFVSVEQCGSDVQNGVRNLSVATAQLLSAAAQKNSQYVNVAARDTSYAIDTVTDGLVFLASEVTDSNATEQMRRIETALNVTDSTLEALNIAKIVLSKAGASADTAEMRPMLAKRGKLIQEILNNVLDFLPGYQELSRVNGQVAEIFQRVVKTQLPAPIPGDNFVSAQGRLNAAAMAFNSSLTTLLTAVKNADTDVTTTSSTMLTKYQEMVEASQALMVHTSDENMKQNVMANLSEVTQSAIRILGNFKTMTVESAASSGSSASAGTAAMISSNANQKNLLANYSRAVGESIVKFLEVATTLAPGHQECNSAAKEISNSISLMEDVNRATDLAGHGYHHYFQQASQNLRSISSNLRTLEKHVKSDSAAASCGEAAAIAALEGAVELSNLAGNVQKCLFLIGAADPSSVASIPGLLDLEKLLWDAERIESGCERMTQVNSIADIKALAGSIAPATASICNSAKIAGQKSSNPVAQNQLAGHAKSVASATAAIVALIKSTPASGIEGFRGHAGPLTAALVSAVRDFISFAGSSEFGPTSAVISPVVLAQQKPIIEGCREAFGMYRDMVMALKALCNQPGDRVSGQLVLAHANGVESSLSSAVVEKLQSQAPGQQESSQALERITLASSTLDSAIVQAQMGALSSSSMGMVSSASASNPFEGFLNLLKAQNSMLDVVSDAAVKDAAKLGPAMEALTQNYLQFIPSATSAAASVTGDRSFQMDLLKATKEFVSALTIMVNTAKKLGGDSRDSAGAETLALHKANVQKVVKRILAQVEGTNAFFETFSNASDLLQTGLHLVDTPESNTAVAGLTFAQVADTLTRGNKTIVEIVNAVISNGGSGPNGKFNPEEAEALANSLAKTFTEMISAGRKVTPLLGNNSGSGSANASASNIVDSIKDLGASGLKLIEGFKAVLTNSSSTDYSSRQKLNSAALEVSTSLSRLTDSLRESQKGLINCQEAQASIGDILGDVDANLIFAQAGQLDPPVGSTESFSSFKEGMLLEVKELLELAKSIVLAVTGGIDRVGDCSINAARKMKSVHEIVKKAAMAITSNDKHNQANLLSVIRASSQSLQTLIESAKTVVTGPSTDNSKTESLKENAKVIVTTLSDLIKVIKNIGDETSRAVRTLDNAMGELTELITEFSDSEKPAQGTALPEDISALVKGLATSTANLVSVASSSNRQDDVIQGVRAIKKLVEDLTRSAKAAISSAPDQEQTRMSNAVRALTQNLGGLLSAVRSQMESNTPVAKSNVQNAAKNVTTGINQVMEAVNGLVPGGYVDPNDPNVIAERELLAAASSIEAAARKLAALKPAERPREANQELKFEDQIVEAAKAIATATSALIKSATTAQREIVSQEKHRSIVGNQSGTAYFSDGTWSDGLVSGAKQVAQANADLCDAANQAVKGTVERERVIVSARNVSASTAQLLSAAAVKTDPNSQSIIRLRAAGKAVTSATEELVKAAETSAAFEESEEDELAVLASKSKSGAGARIVEMEAQMQMLALEKQLEKARERLAGIRKNKYNSKQT